MVSLSDVQASNASIAKLPRLVAVFVGATAGIGETSLKQFAKHANKPRVYFVGRSQEAADRIKAQCKTLNPEGEYIFIKADVSLIANVDAVCKEIKEKETNINILFLTQGTLMFGTKTSEGLHYATALAYYSRTRFVQNLLPLIESAPTLRRVITILAGTKEGPIFANDFQGWKVPVLAGRGHLVSMLTLSLEELAKKAPNVSFIHNFPGAVKGNLIRGGEGFLIATLSIVFKVIGPFVYIPLEETGDRLVFLATSARYPARTKLETSGVSLVDGIAVARGVDGKVGSGVYSVDEKGESAAVEVEELLAKFKTDGTMEKMWKDTQDIFEKTTGKTDG